MTFQFSLWDKFKELANLAGVVFNNLVQLVTHFLQRKCLSLSILKVSVPVWSTPSLVSMNSTEHFVMFSLYGTGDRVWGTG